MAGALVDAEEPYEVVSMTRTETVPLWGFGMSASLRVAEKDARGIPDELSLANGKRLNVVMRHRQPLCHGCGARGHLKKNCCRAEDKNVKVEAAEEGGATGGTIEVEPVVLTQ